MPSHKAGELKMFWDVFHVVFVPIVFLAGIVLAIRDGYKP